MNEQHARAMKVIADTMFVAPDNVTPDSKLIADLGADSLDVVEISMALENEFAITINDDDAEKCRTVADVLALVDRAGA